jgi:hypothetical protein
LHSVLIQAGQELLQQKTRIRHDWFNLNQHELLLAILERNKAYETTMKAPHVQSNQLLLREKRKKLRAVIKASKLTWIEKIANDLVDKNFSMTPKQTWEQVKIIQGGFQAHHKKMIITNFTRLNGTPATDNKENADIITEHFDKVYNGEKTPINIPQLLREIQQRPTVHEFNEIPTMEELEHALLIAHPDKAPGPSGISPKAFKTLSDNGKQYLLNILIKVYNGDLDPPEFHQASLKMLHKKGDKSNPSNWRGIALKEASVKLLSSIINQRLLKILSLYGVENQYGAQKGKGCRDGIFTLRAALETRRLHNQETWVIFADLIKAFDMANHELLFALLPQYGVPPTLTRIIQQLYTNMHVHLTHLQEKRSIPYTIGVQQGDNMAPVLFLFIMQAFAETLEQNWRKWGLDPPEFKFMDRGLKSKGRLLNQSTAATGTAFNLFYLLFVDDGAFLFNTKEQLIKGAELLYDHFHKFGLKMHIGKHNEASKTEIMYFPPNLQTDISNMNNLQIPIKDGNLKSSKNFVYLGVNQTSNLKNEDEVQRRILKATSQIGALKNFFSEKRISLKTKYRIYMALPLSTLLWGSESWTLTENIKRLLRSFQHRTIRRILNISMQEVQDYKITNESIRKTFNNIPDIINIIKRRQMTWIGSIAKMNVNRLPRKLMASWLNDPRTRGKPQSTYRNSFASAISTLLPSVNHTFPLTDWLDIAASKQWPTLIDKWWKSLTQNTVSLV